MKWNYLWPYAQTGWGWTVAIVSVFTVTFYGPKKMLETWDWYMARFRDHSVKSYLESKASVRRNATQQLIRYGSVQPLDDICGSTKLSKRRVLASLKRLQKRGQVSGDGDHWKISDY